MMGRDELRRDLEKGAAILAQVCDVMRDHMGTDEIAFLMEQTVAEDDSLPALHAEVARHLARAIAAGQGVTEAIEAALDAVELGVDAKLN